MPRCLGIFCNKRMDKRMLNEIIKKIRGDRGQAQQLIAVVLLLCLIIGVFIPLVQVSVSPKITVASSISYLEGLGYHIKTPGECYPDSIVPCADDTQTLGTEDKRWKAIWVSSESVNIGSVTISNTAQQMDIDGQLVMHGAGKVWKEVQPDLDYASIIAQGKPTEVFRGPHSGFSLPVYNDDKEELFVGMDVIREWDGITDPIVHIHCYVPGGNGWDSPTGRVDVPGWIGETLAYDESLGSSASHGTSGNRWTDFIAVTITADNYSNIRFYADYNAVFINEIDLDAYYSGGWHDVYQGSFADKEWVVKPLGGTYSVSSYRMRFYNDSSSFATARLYETDIGDSNGNFKLEIGYSTFSPCNNDIVSDSSQLVWDDIATVPGEYVSYIAEMPIDASSITTCDELGIRVRRVAASENEIDGEVVITHIGIRFLRDKLGEVIP